MVSEKKKKNLEKLKKILKSYKCILLFDLKDLPSKQLHIIRNKLKEKEIYTMVSKKRILEFALKENKIDMNLDDIGQLGVVYSNKDIFEIIRILRNLKVKRKAKVNEIISEDIEIPAGDTNIQAGPAISIFKQFKIPTIMKGGIISIKDPTIVCRAGDKITLELVSLLNMLGVEPIEMNISPEKGHYENLIFNKFVLQLDKDYFKENIKRIADHIFKLTTYLGYPTKDNIDLLLQKGIGTAKNLSIILGYPTKENIKDLLLIAKYNANKLNNL